MRLGVFGGSFNPVHLGHLILAEQCREQASLDQVLFTPAARPPHKQDETLAPYEKRVEMLNLAISGRGAFCIDELEKDRPGPSYTVDTLAQLQQRHPASKLFLIIGSDSLRDLPSWYQPIRILELAGLVVVPRRNCPVMDIKDIKQALSLPPSFSFQYQVCDVPLIDIASNDIRRRIAEGKSVRYLIPRAVEAYIRDKHLYELIKQTENREPRTENRE